MTAATAKPTPFRSNACRNGRGPLCLVGMAADRGVRRSGCVCEALETNGCQLWLVKRRLCALAFGAANRSTRQRRPGNIARRPDHQGCALFSVGAWRATLATQREAVSKDWACVAWRQHQRQLDGFPTRTSAVSRVEQLIRPLGRAVPARLAQLNSTMLRALSCE